MPTRRSEERYLISIYVFLFIIVLVSYARAGKCPDPEIKGVDNPEIVQAAKDACQERYGSNACLYKLEKQGERYAVMCGPEVESNGK